VRWRPEQEASLAHLCSNPRSFGKLVTFLGFFLFPRTHFAPPALIRRPCSNSAPGELCPPSLRPWYKISSFKLYYLRKGDELFSHFGLLICWLNANTTEWICMQIWRNMVNGTKSNKYVLVGIWVIVCIQKPSHHVLQTFRPLRMFNPALDLAHRGVRQTVQSHTFYAPLLVFDTTLAQSHFAVVNRPDVVMSVFYSRFNAQPDIFAVMNCCVVALSLFSSDIVTWALIVYVQCNDTEKRGCSVAQETKPCQLSTPPRLWYCQFLPTGAHGIYEY